MSRLSKALVVALALHGLLLLRSVKRSQAPNSPTVHAPEELVVVEEVREDEPEPVAAPAEGIASTAPRAVRTQSSAARAPVAAAASEGESTETAPSGGDAVANGAGPSAAAPQAGPAAPERKIDFGIDDGFFMRPPSEQMPRVKKPVFQQQMEAAIAADDVRHGLARGNVFLGSLNAAARDVGPVRGEAIFSVTVGSDGSLTSAEILNGSGAEWASVMNSFRALAASKRLRVPHGAHGLRVTFSVQAKVQRPSGKDVDASGNDITPDGNLRHTFDVSDLGAGTQRLVYAHVVSEEVL